MIQFPCPVCATENSAPEEVIGSLLKCVGCGKSVGVPKQSGGTIATKKCPACASEIPVAARLCPRCRESTEAQPQPAGYPPPPVAYAQPTMVLKVEDDTFTGGEIAGIVLGTLFCPGIAALAGFILLIVNFVQGKWRRGLVYTAVWIVAAIWAVIAVIASNLGGGGP